MTSPSLSLSLCIRFSFPCIYSVYKFTQFLYSYTHPMSVAFEHHNNHNNNINNNTDSNRMWVSNLPDTTRFTGGYPWTTTLPAVKEEDDTTSSSIGNDSDSGDNDTEVQSKDDHNNNNINGMLNGLSDLEQVLPIKRGISTFYAGKSKSYGSLDEAVSIESIQDIVKPEDAYSRKRKNMIAHHALMGGVSKRLARNNQSAAMAGRVLPPLPRSSRNVHANELSDSSGGMCVSSRSFSLSDLQHASSFNGVINNGSKMDGN
ncbi:protein OXIDATIVE STRESS 3 LIKE 2-like [Bidens hawaiensis]|uniref:protein OXIDATIVE STRESS 3 LIKE 2-like n=1 Tax=Bidens hawaiensis TaxID=980011 RepID=UPI00404AB072